MIAYPISRAALAQRIEAHAPGWLNRAAARTAGFQAQGAYSETSTIWSEVKQVYMTLQGASKCAFCERKLESVKYGKGEQAVEHFRPKGSIKPWKLPASLAAEGVNLAPPPPAKGGYYLLAYDIFNYSAACGPCNSVLKRDYFPVAAQHTLHGAQPEALAAELPLLLYPIGDFDTPPESLIRFHGLSPQPVAPAGHPRHRALVTIDFFQLDSVDRANLIRERAAVILALFPALEALHSKTSKSRKATAQQIVDGFTSPNAPHSNCARSFVALFQTDQPEAETIFELAGDIITSKS